MDSDSIISSALDIYSDESTIDNVEKMTLKIKTENVKVHKILHNLFYDIMNIDFNLWSWIRNLTKYGDFFMKKIVLDWLAKYIDDVTEVEIKEDKILLLRNGKTKAIIVYQKIR